ncbi:MAG: serine hydrolase domain-containing protein, partial [Rhodothermales bacterium]
MVILQRQKGDVLQWMAFATEKLTNYEQEDFYRDLRAVHLNVIPGVYFSYSNVGVQLAGFILERVYDQPFQVLVDSLVTHPLEMKNTRPTLRPDEIERLATGYDDQGRPMPTDRTAAGAAGGLMSTISDLSKYAHWHLDERDPVIELSHTMPEGDTNGPVMGLSWYIEHSQEGVRRLSSDGTVPGFSTRIVLYPELDIAAVVLTNQLDGAIPGLTDRLAHEVLESLNPQAFTYE